MKKFLLLLVAVVLAGGLVLSCSQPSSYDITLKPGSAEGVAPDSIKVEAINGYNLITWKSTPDTDENYTVYRKSIIDGEIDEGTIKIIQNAVNITPIKGIAFTWDSDTVADAQYVYGIVSRGFKEGGADVVAISDLVWQNEPEGGYVTAKKPAAGTELAEAPAVTVVGTPVRVNTLKTSTTGTVDVSDKIVITVKGLVPGYSYTFGIAWSHLINPNNTTPTALTEAQWSTWGAAISSGNADYYRGWTQINSNNDVFSVADYLDYGDTIELPETTLQYTYDGTNPGSFYDYATSSVAKHALDSWTGRLYVQYGKGSYVDATYPVTVPNQDVSNTGTRFYSNEAKLLDIAK